MSIIEHYDHRVAASITVRMKLLSPTYGELFQGETVSLRAPIPQLHSLRSYVTSSQL